MVTGGYGVLGASMSEGLAEAGANVAVLGRDKSAAETKASELRSSGAEALALVADVLDEEQLTSARDQVLDTWGRLDILINAAGGNVARARTDDKSVFDVPRDGLSEVIDLNLYGTIRPTLVFGETMAKRGRGSIVNVSSMASITILSGIVGYSAAKAAIDNFTRWMAVELARRYGEGMRVNAIAPGFFVTTQNRALLVAPDGSHTDRAKAILARSPMRRFGNPSEVKGPVVWLCSDAASFVTGTVIEVDGGFSADSGI